VILGNQKNENKWIGLSLFFFGSIPQTGLHRKRKRREKLAFVWEKQKKKTRFFVPKSKSFFPRRGKEGFA
jgi:hypothetical protein